MSRRAVAGAAALLAGAALAVTVPTIDRPSSPSDGVELPTAPDSAEPNTPPASAEPNAPPASAGATDASDVVDPVRCEPAGCERWRRLLPTSTATVAGADGFVAVLAGGRVEVVDAATGDVRWRARTGGPARDGTYTVAFDPPVALAAGHGMVVATGGRGWVQVREAADGALRWSASSGWRVGSVALAGDDVVVIASQPAAGAGRHRLRALNAADGQELWEVEVDRLVSVLDDQLLAAVGAVTRSLEPTTGEVRFEADGHATPAGPWLAVDDGTFTRLLDPADGQPLTVLQGPILAGPVQAGETWVTILAHPSRPWANPFRPLAMGLDADGEVRWMFELDVEQRTCCVLTDWSTPGTALLASAGGDVGYVVDGADGRVLERLEPSPIDVAGAMVDGGMWVGRPGDSGLLLQAERATVQVVGEAALVHHQPPVVAAPDALLGLRLVGQGEGYRPFRGAR